MRIDKFLKVHDVVDRVIPVKDLIVAGVDMPTITGGWSCSSVSNATVTPTTEYDKFTFNVSSGIVTTPRYASVVTLLPINVSDYKTLVVDLVSGDNGSFPNAGRLYISLIRNRDDDPTTDYLGYISHTSPYDTIDGYETLNVKAITGLCYIAVYVYAAGSDLSINIRNMYLRP